MYLNAFSLLAVAGASVGIGSVAAALTHFILKGWGGHVPAVDKAVIGWLLYDAVTHLTLVMIGRLHPYSEFKTSNNLKG